MQVLGRKAVKRACGGIGVTKLPPQRAAPCPQAEIQTSWVAIQDPCRPDPNLQLPAAASEPGTPGTLTYPLRPE